MLGAVTFFFVLCYFNSLDTLFPSFSMIFYGTYCTWLYKYSSCDKVELKRQHSV